MWANLYINLTYQRPNLNEITKCICLVHQAIQREVKINHDIILQIISGSQHKSLQSQKLYTIVINRNKYNLNAKFICFVHAW